MCVSGWPHCSQQPPHSFPQIRSAQELSVLILRQHMGTWGGSEQIFTIIAGALPLSITPRDTRHLGEDLLLNSDLAQDTDLGSKLFARRSTTQP